MTPKVRSGFGTTTRIKTKTRKARRLNRVQRDAL
jgi:hypothetical protein